MGRFRTGLARFWALRERFFRQTRLRALVVRYTRSVRGDTQLRATIGFHRCGSVRDASFVFAIQ